MKRTRWMHGAWPLAALLATASCATTTERSASESAPTLEVSVGRIADRLVRAAELRTDLRSLRTRIDSIEPEAGTSDRLVADQGDRIGTVLRREFMLVLANDIYIVDSDGEPGRRRAIDEAPGGAEAGPAATHQLVGDYVCMGDALFLSMRLVDTRTRVIVAAARGPIPRDAIGDLGEPGEPQGAVAAVVTPPAVTENLLPAPAAAAPDTSTVLLAEPPWTMPGEPLEDVEFVPLEDEPRYLDSPPLRGQEAPGNRVVDPPVEKDFQVWRARRLAKQGKGSGEGIMPAAEDPEDVAESYEEWRRRKLADGSTSAPEPVAPKLDRAGTPASAAGGHVRFPWRNPQLDALLGIPGDSSGGRDDRSRPWRTRELAEILDVPPEK